MDIHWDNGRGDSEASDMGWTPGEWPESFEAPDDTGNVRTFRKMKDGVRRDRENDIVSVKYVNADGTVIEVFND